jgi:hypothetical protein
MQHIGGHDVIIVDRRRARGVLVGIATALKLTPGVFVLLLALIQLPFAVYQRLVLMPVRLNMPKSVVPVDIVAGTMEGSITGGANNNVMVYLLITVLVGLIALRREGAIRSAVFWLLLPVVAAPLALGETKLAVAP